MVVISPNQIDSVYANDPNIVTKGFQQIDPIYQTAIDESSKFQKLYEDIAAGRVNISPENFNTLFTNADLGMSEFEFNQLPISVRQAAYKNPQQFIQYVMANRNPANRDLLSIGAEGGYSTYNTANWLPQTGFQFDPNAYMNVNDDGGLFGLGDLGTALAIGAGMYFGMPYLSEAFAGGAGALGAGEGLSQAGMLAAQEAGFGAADLAGWGGSLANTTQAGMLASQYVGLGYSPQQATQLAAADIASAGGAGGSSTLFGNNLFNQLGESAIKQGVKSALGTGQQPSGTGGTMATTDWGGMLGNLLGGAGTYLGTNAALGNYADAASQLAAGVKFKPYAITSDIGRTYQDPVTGEMVSSLAAPFAAQQQGMLGQVGANLAAAQADPMLAAQDAYNKMRQLSSFEEQQKQQELENRLLQQGMLGSTGGAARSRAMQDAIMQNQVNQQLQSIGLGQQLTGNALNRAMQAWTGAMAPTAAMAGQMGQSGAFGQYAQGGQLKAADIMNQANLGKLGLQTKTIGGLFGSPTFSSTGQQTSPGGVGTQLGNWLGGNVGNWLSGSTTPTDYSSWGQLNTFGQTPIYDFSMPGALDYNTGENLLGMLGW